MKTLTKIFLSSIIFLSMGCSGIDETVEKERKVIFIIVDGISNDILERAETPNLDRIAEMGSLSTGWLGGIAGEYSQSPTISAVGYNHVLTGVWSNKHNVYTNTIEEPNYNYWNIFRLFKYHHPEKSVAIYSSWLDNRTKLVGDGLPEAGNINIDIYFDGFDVDTLAFPHDYGYVQRIDDHVATLAAESISTDAPTLSWVYLWYTDSTGHEYGEFDEHYESIEVADDQVGRIWDAVQYRTENYDEEWLFVVTTDHGRRLPDGRDHGGHTERERTIWMISNLPEMNTFFHEGHPPVTSIYPTIARYLDLEITNEHQYELDGIPLLGDVSISDPLIRFNSDEQVINLEWTALNNDGEVRIHIATTNQFQEGGHDEYTHIKTVSLTDEQTEIDISEFPSNFYKVVLEAKYNTVNLWVVAK